MPDEGEKGRQGGHVHERKGIGIKGMGYSTSRKYRGQRMPLDSQDVLSAYGATRGGASTKG